MNKTLAKYPKDLYAAIFGRRHHWHRHRQYQGEIGDIFATLTDLDRKFDFPRFERLSAKDVAPILVLSAGWRSGSTMVQRLLCSADKTFLWGEPFGDTGLFSQPAKQLVKFTASWPDESCFVKPSDELDDFRNSWIANLYPDVDALRCAYRAFFDQLLAAPSHLDGVSHWGFKEIRLDSADAAFFKWIYPSAKLIFLVRNPVDAYVSYAPHRPWYISRPETPIVTAKQFALHWSKLASSFVCDHQRLNALLLKYEDLVYGSPTLTALEEYLDIKLDSEVLRHNVNISNASRRKPYRLLPGERRLIQKYCGEAYSALGYDTKTSAAGSGARI